MGRICGREWVCASTAGGQAVARSSSRVTLPVFVSVDSAAVVLWGTLERPAVARRELPVPLTQAEPMSVRVTTALSHWSMLALVESAARHALVCPGSLPGDTPKIRWATVALKLKRLTFPFSSGSWLGLLDGPRTRRYSSGHRSLYRHRRSIQREGAHRCTSVRTCRGCHRV
jgi:hypothetical protein